MAENRLLLKVTEAAELVGLGRSKAYELTRTGVWPTVRIGKSVRIPYRWLIKWVDEQTAEATANLEEPISLDR